MACDFCSGTSFVHEDGSACAAGKSQEHWDGEVPWDAEAWARNGGKGSGGGLPGCTEKPVRSIRVVKHFSIAIAHSHPGLYSSPLLSRALSAGAHGPDVGLHPQPFQQAVDATPMSMSLLRVQNPDENSLKVCNQCLQNLPEVCSRTGWRQPPPC